MKKTFRFFAPFVVVTALYLAVAKVGLMYAVVGGTVTLVWGPSGIALAALLLFGWRMVLAVALGALLANLGTGIALPAVFAIAAGNTLAAVVGAALLGRFPGFEIDLKTPHSVFALVVLAAVLSTTVSATVGAATLRGLGFGAGEPLAILWLKWWLGDMMGVLVVAPPLMLWKGHHWQPPSPRKAVEACCLGLALALVSLEVFGTPALAANQFYAAPMAVFPFVIWASLRFYQLGASLVVLAFSLMAVWGAAHGAGPFMTGNSLSDLLQWCGFSTVVVVVGLILSVSVSQQRRTQEALVRSVEGLEHHIARRTRDLACANADLNREMTERRNLEVALVRLSEEQRRMVGCELHDGLGQHMASLSLLCGGLVKRLSDRAQPEAEAAQRIGKIVDEAAVMTRSVARGLYPVALEHGGLPVALEQLAEHASACSAMRCVYGGSTHIQVDDPLVAINLYRIAQEAVANAVKYSKASLVQITLVRANGQYQLSVIDDGIGIVPQRLLPGQGIGLHSMQYRASLLGGCLQVKEGVPHGTTVVVTYPDSEVLHGQRSDS